MAWALPPSPGRRRSPGRRFELATGTQAPDPADRPASAAQVLALLAAALPADAAEEDRLWPTWATGRLPGWQASAMARPPLAPRPA
jgi:hypothetical protein